MLIFGFYRYEIGSSAFVAWTFSLANIVKETRKIMNDSDDAYKIPDDAREISQLLFLFNSADPSERRSLVSDDYSRSHITVNAKNMGSFEYKELVNDVEVQIQKIVANPKSGFPKLEVNLTGSIATLMVVTDDIAKSQFDGFSLALGLISLIMIVTLGSVRAGVMGMIPNAIPAFLAFGLMGLFVIPLDADTLLIAPVILGIAVDDTIHFMTHYRIELIKTKDIGLALKSAIREVGQAVMFTTMIIGLGVAGVSFSEYLGLAYYYKVFLLPPRRPQILFFGLAGTEILRGVNAKVPLPSIFEEEGLLKLPAELSCFLSGGLLSATLIALVLRVMLSALTMAEAALTSSSYSTPSTIDRSGDQVIPPSEWWGPPPSTRPERIRSLVTGQVGERPGSPAVRKCAAGGGSGPGKLQQLLSEFLAGRCAVVNGSAATLRHRRESETRRESR